MNCSIKKMYRSTRLFRLVIVLFIPLTALSYAQGNDGADKPRKEVRGKSAYIIYTAGGKFFDKPVMVKSGKKVTEIQLSKRYASDKISVNKEGIVDFVTPNPNDEENPYTSYARAVVPETVKNAIIILSPVKKANSTQLFAAKVVDLSSFKKGDWLFVNQTPTGVGIQLGELKQAINPGESYLFDAKQFKKPTNLTVAYNYLHPTKKKWQLLSASTTVIRPTRREICIFSWNTKTQKVNYHGITFTEIEE